MGRTALLLSVALAWLNFFLTTRWTAIPGSVHGTKQPFYVATLLVLTTLTVGWRDRATVPRRRATLLWPSLACGAGCLFLAVAFVEWFPPSVWTQIPALDDWPPRYQSTQEGLQLLRHAAFSGWRWGFLGGYPIATDITQNLTVWAAVPTLLFGPAVGFHVTHLLLFAAIPLLVWYDLRLGAAEERDVALVAAGLAAVLSANYSYFLLRSGDTNSLTGAVAALATIVAAHAARARPGRFLGALALLGALTLATYSHQGFFLYALVMLVVDAAVARDRRSLGRAAIAAAGALIAGLPLTWELWRYPAYFIPNNVELHPAAFNLAAFVRKVYYNTELLVRPGRWFNDFTGLANVCLPLLAWIAWRARERPRFYACAVLAVVLLVRFSYESFGYVFLRPIILLPLFLAPPLAWFAQRVPASRLLSLAFLAFCALYIQVWWQPVPHVRHLRDLQPELVDRLPGAAGDLVLVENAFHRDVDTSPGTVSVPTPFDAHFESVLPATSGRRLYAGMWDGWQWTPNRDQVFANGTFRGTRLRDVDIEVFRRELARWGVRELFVWSAPAKSFLVPADFEQRETFGRWSHYAVREPAPVSATVMTVKDWWSATLHVTGVRRGDRIPIHTNYHPAWSARAAGQPLALANADGQLAFTAPADGDFDVELAYPRRPWLLVLAVLALAVAGLAMHRLLP